MVTALDALLPTTAKLTKALASGRRPKGYQIPSGVLNRIWLERLRQQNLLKIGKHPFTCATAGIPIERKLAILTEEVGEVARAVNELIAGHPFDHRRVKIKAELHKEITQVAAVAVAWLESLEQETK